MHIGNNVHRCRRLGWPGRRLFLPVCPTVGLVCHGVLRIDHRRRTAGTKKAPRKADPSTDGRSVSRAGHLIRVLSGLVTAPALRPFESATGSFFYAAALPSNGDAVLGFLVSLTRSRNVARRPRGRAAVFSTFYATAAALWGRSQPTCSGLTHPTAAACSTRDDSVAETDAYGDERTSLVRKTTLPSPVTMRDSVPRRLDMRRYRVQQTGASRAQVWETTGCRFKSCRSHRVFNSIGGEVLGRNKTMSRIPGPWNLPADASIVIQYPSEATSAGYPHKDILAIFLPSHPVSMLIRAAPKLLEACKDADELLRTTDKPIASLTTYERACRITRNNCLAAIAEATQPLADANSTEGEK